MIFSTGYVQTPGWDGQTIYPSYMDSWARVVVPATRWVMFSLIIDVQFKTTCSKDRVTLYRGNASSSVATEAEEIIKVCDANGCPTLIKTDVLYVHFVSGERDSGVPKTGFKLLFSFHNQSALLREVQPCLWNCSVPFWPDFRQHFPCNAWSECWGHEDEVECPYSSEACAPGQLSAGGGCYTYRRVTSVDNTWEDTTRMCRARGSRLASLNSPDKWRDILKALGMRSVFLKVYIGLSTSSPALPDMLVCF